MSSIKRVMAVADSAQRGCTYKQYVLEQAASLLTKEKFVLLMNELDDIFAVGFAIDEVQAMRDAFRKYTGKMLP